MTVLHERLFVSTLPLLWICPKISWKFRACPKAFYWRLYFDQWEYTVCILLIMCMNLFPCIPSAHVLYKRSYLKKKVFTLYLFSCNLKLGFIYLYIYFEHGVNVSFLQFLAVVCLWLFIRCMNVYYASLEWTNNVWGTVNVRVKLRNLTTSRVTRWCSG